MADKLMTPKDDKPAREFDHKCEVCGTPVRIVGSTTKSYESAYDSLNHSRMLEIKAIDKLEAALKIATDALNLAKDEIDKMCHCAYGASCWSCETLDKLKETKRDFTIERDEKL